MMFKVPFRPKILIRGGLPFRVGIKHYLGVWSNSQLRLVH